MLVKWNSERKLNVKQLARELGQPVRIVQPRCTDTVIDPETGEESFVTHEMQLEVGADEGEQSSNVASPQAIEGEDPKAETPDPEIVRILDAHAPSMTDAEEAFAAAEAAAEDNERPKLRKRVLKLLKEDADFRARVIALLK